MAGMAAAGVAETPWRWRSIPSCRTAIAPPRFGRDTDLSLAEIGLAGHWLEYMLHLMFLHKVRLTPGWRRIPE
jgi:hypothetical protein